MPLPNSFDVITAFAVIEHMSDPGFLLRWSFDHLKPGGILIVMTGDRESSTAQAMDADWPLYYSIEHLSFFSARSPESDGQIFRLPGLENGVAIQLHALGLWARERLRPTRK